MMKTFKLEIVTPDGVMFEGQAESLLVKCASGDVEVLAGHADLFSPLAVGRARIKYDAKSRAASCAGGFLSVTKEKVTLVATTFEFADEIDVGRAKSAAETAEAAIKDAQDDAALEKAKLKLSRALNRIKVSELK